VPAPRGGHANCMALALTVSPFGSEGMRWKLIVGNLVAVLVVGIVGFFMVRGQASEALSQDIDPLVERSVGLFDAVRTAEGERYKSIVEEIGLSEAAGGVYASNITSERQSAAFAFAERQARELATQYPPQSPRQADIVLLTDSDGKVLARNVDQNGDTDRDLRGAFEVVRYALEGTGHVARDFLRYDGQKWYDVAIAPVRVGGQMRGLVLVGYEIADSIASVDNRRLGAHVGYLFPDNNRYVLYSASLGTQGDKDTLSHWANEAGTNLHSLFATDRPSGVTAVTLNGDTWRVVARAMPGIYRPRGDAARPGFVVLANRSDAQDPSTGIALPIAILAVLGILLGVGVNLWMTSYILKPIEQIEEGLLRVINGDQDHRIEIQHAELGGIVYRINQLISQFSGAEEETDEAGRIEKAQPRPQPVQQQQPAQMFIDESSIGNFNPAAESQLLSMLQNEGENDYYERLRKEFNAARQKLGQGSDGMSHEQFVETVRSNEQRLAQQYSVALVRLEVQTQGNQVVFRAIPIR